MSTPIATLPGLGLLLLLGARHGLDPDHIAVIDNLTFRAADERKGVAQWVGTLFALGHSLSVAAVAVGVGLVAWTVVWPAWLADAVDWAAIGLLVVIGLLNLRAVRSAETYAPVGWRGRLLPRALRETTHPAAILLVGIVFGLVFDTATQAAAWGLAASASGGVAGAIAISLTFACGMVFTDTLDSQIVARLLRGTADRARVGRYRRWVGWLIVALSFGMAAYALASKLALVEASDRAFTLIGVAMAFSVVAAILTARRSPGTPRPTA